MEIANAQSAVLRLTYPVTPRHGATLKNLSGGSRIWRVVSRFKVPKRERRNQLHPEMSLNTGDEEKDLVFQQMISGNLLRQFHRSTIFIEIVRPTTSTSSEMSKSVMC